MSFRFTCDQTMFCVKIFSLKINGKADFVTGLSQTACALSGKLWLDIVPKIVKLW